MKRAFLLPLVVTAVVMGLTTPASAATNDWRADLSTVDSDDSNVTARDGQVRLDGTPARLGTQRAGFLVLAPHRLAQPANSIAATPTGSVPAGTEAAVDVRGALGDDQWTEWVEARPDAPAVLPSSVRIVQVRVVLTAPDGVDSPTVRSLSLRASSVPANRDEIGTMAAGLSYRVYATREGLVGGTTANGHVIASRDHFVALPSRRGLSAKGTGTYSVRVCASNGRCEWAPVWDVGPWNTTDDYWNPASTRQSWKDLPQGKPEAQAAYENGYNGGKDQFGRAVANPAGIDLADGTFWDGLKLTTNSWVTATYQWTGSGPAGVVHTAGDALNVRAGATSTATQVGLAANLAQVRVECQLTGQSVSGSQGTSNIWFRIAAGKYIAKAYVSGVSGAGTC
jgi:hypothetical protein